jgi:hypothetical protein
MKFSNKYKKIIAHSLMFIVFVFPLISYGAGLVPCGGPDEKMCEYEDFIKLIIGVIKFLIELGVAFSAVVFAYAGWLYLTSGGNEGQVEKAHEMFTKVLWGFLIALGAFLIVQLITSSLGLKTEIIKI